jgi:hypothetical protein
MLISLTKRTIFSMGMITSVLTSRENEIFPKPSKKMTNVDRSMSNIAIFLTLDDASNSALIEKEFISLSDKITDSLSTALRADSELPRCESEAENSVTFKDVEYFSDTQSDVLNRWVSENFQFFRDDGFILSSALIHDIHCL